jgi:glycosyltransferase involved in cell wall biosynthesis
VKTLRICYLANASSIHTRKWVRYFIERGHEIHVISFENGQIEGTTVHNLKLPVLVRSATFPLKLASIYRMRVLIRSIKPDVLHAHYVTNYGFFGALCDYKPFVLTALGSDILSVQTESPLIRFIKKLITTYVAKKADAVTVDARSLMKRIIEFGAPPEKVQLISHGVSLKEFNPNKKSSLFKKALKIPSASQVVISTRNLEKVYNVETVIKAIPTVVKANPNVRFLVIGEGTQKRYLQNLAANLNVKKYVTFVGKIPNEDVAKFLANSDIYLSTSLSDSTSVSLLEAMAAQLPVVVTDIEGNREWIKNGENGFIVPKTRPEFLAEKITLLLDDEETAEKFGVRNRKIVEEKANYNKEMAKVEKIYEQIAA